ncbi:MAG: PD40 domain-containing protein [Chloroflexi bacterium]|uniref:PD40 domain-containing protein n=1 Tax=Candidatus Chlorohelix allophototropha TaxID=3003348 RepID=A0A8T7MAB8_9CHLR|nr:PD40 domain-containing protein [Chloroflexota bacterium]WJW68933.1 hypothetical protein OZ401_004555 [Chloroflexota bacterium L227-S17]
MNVYKLVPKLLVGIMLSILLIACGDNSPTIPINKTTPSGTPDVAAQATIIAALAATEAAQPTVPIEFSQSNEDEVAPTPTPAPSPSLNGKIPAFSNIAAPISTPSKAISIGQFSGVPGGITAAALSYDRKWLAFSSRYQIWLMEVASGKFQIYYINASDPDERGAASLSWAADGRKLVAGGFHGITNMWRWDSIDNRLRPGAARLRPDASSVNFGEQVEVSFSPDGKYIAGLGNEGTLVIWDSEYYTQLYSFNADYAGFFAWSPDGKLIADEYLKVHQLANGLSYTAAGAVRVTSEKPQGVAWSADGKMLAVTAEDFKMARFEAPTQTSLSVSKLLGKAQYEDSLSIPRDQLKLGKRVAFSPDSKWLATANVPASGRISLWNAITGQFLFEINTGNKPINTLSWGSAGVLIAGGDDGTLRFWQIA